MRFKVVVMRFGMVVALIQFVWLLGAFVRCYEVYMDGGLGLLGG